MSKNEAIALYQPLLYSIALKMVGTLEEAEDIVQDTFEKWLRIDTQKVQNVKAYLIRSVSNNCLSYLSSFWSQVSRDSEEDLEMVDEQPTKSILQLDLDVQLAEAWSIIHKKLEPVEKQIFILREVFNVEYEELQVIFDKKKDNCRQIFSRAKAKLKGDREKEDNSFSDQTIPENFSSACQTGIISGLIEELKK